MLNIVYLTALAAEINDMLMMMEGERREEWLSDGLDRLNAWLADEGPTPSPLHHPSSPWRVDEGATTSSRTCKSSWD